MDAKDRWTDDIARVDSVLAKHATHYNMNHRHRGVAVIFNQERFDDSAVNERRGSQKDCESLDRSFVKLGFKVEKHIDLTLADVECTLQDLSERNHSNSDCFVVVFMSHGLEGRLRAKDRVFDVNLLWECFTADRCPSLANKPKLFFIQACQGHDRQGAVLVSGPSMQLSSEKVKLIPSYTLPQRADFLVALSTIPGFVSWRSPESGSWYIQSLCRHLDSSGFDQDILTLLTNVSREVALDHTFCDPKNPEEPCKKQLPSVHSMLIRVLQFTQKKKKCSGKQKSTEEEANEEAEEEGERLPDSISLGMLVDEQSRKRSNLLLKRGSLSSQKKRRKR